MYDCRIHFWDSEMVMLTEGLGSDSSSEIERDALSAGGLKFRALLVRLTGGSHGGRHARSDA
ncbi:MAG TPA: hypothetical protein DHW67_01715 [Agrobacterium sp.]|nr:hypothetical protein [Agrobacterium sp.]